MPTSGRMSKIHANIVKAGGNTAKIKVVDEKNKFSLSLGGKKRDDSDEEIIGMEKREGDLI